MKKLSFFLLIILTLFSTISSFAQLNRVFNSDTIFYFGSKWNTKIGNQLIPFDSTIVIVKFNDEENLDNIINYLQVHQIEIIDSLYDYKLCRLTTGIPLSRRLDSLNGTTFFANVSLNISCISTTVDPLFRYQRYINPVAIGAGSETVLNVTNIHNLDSAWHYTRGNPKIIVAVIDIYPDWSHEDIGMGIDGYENVWKNSGEDPWVNPNDPNSGDSVDNDGNGLIDDWKGWDFFNNTNDTRPRTIYDKHGTNVAGILAAKSNNSTGIAGIAGGNYLSSGTKEGIQLMTINCFNSKIDSNSDQTSNLWLLAQSIDYASKHNAKIIALSLATSSSYKEPIIEDVIASAKNQYNCSIYCGAGNEPRSLMYPASNENVYSVGATDVTGMENIYCHGDYEKNLVLDFVALGENIVTTSINDTYVSDFNGTSSASPQVSGVAALLYSYVPCATDQMIYETLKLTASKNVLQSSYLFDNYTNSNTAGYGLPNATDAMLLLNSYKISNHHITSNTTWTTPKIASADIIVDSTRTLTIKSTLIMSENSKIIVRPGGNLILDSAHVTSTCGWKGIEVYGLPSEDQNSNTFGEVFIKNKGKVEGAWIGVHSIYGGIIHSIDSAIFRNNDQSILIEKYSKTDYLTEIRNTKFIADGPFLPSYNSTLGTFNGVHSFIKTIDLYSLYIDSCTFINNYEKSLFDVGFGIYCMNTNGLHIYNSTFNGMSRAVNVTGYGGIVNNLTVEDCNFSNVLQGIRVINMKTYIKRNTFNLARVGKMFYPIYNVHGSFGIYAHSCVNYITDNTFNTENGKSYGVILRNSRSYLNSDVHHNIFTNLKYGTQIEQSNKTLNVYCNEYSNISTNAWSVNPFYVGSGYFPMQGDINPSLPNGARRAGNLFFDRELTNGLQRHIRTSVDFVYNAANNPSEAIPEYISSILTVNPFAELNDESCDEGGGGLIYCGEAECTVAELFYLLGLGNKDSANIYKKAIVEALIAENKIADVFLTLINWNDSPETNEYLFESYLNLNEYALAEDVLNTIDTTGERDLDYYHFYSIILNQYTNNLNRDSLTTVQLSTMEDIASRTNDVSDLAKSYLNFYKNGSLLMVPEEWEEESSRPINNFNTPKIEPLKVNRSNSFGCSLFPNPTSLEATIIINSDDLDSRYKIEIINAIGNKQMEYDIIAANEKIKLNTAGLTAGVYTLKVIDQYNIVLNKRFVIIR